MLFASAAAATMLMLSGCSAAAPGESESPAKAPATSEETAAEEVLGDDPGNPDPLPELTPAGSTVGIGESIIVRENDSDGWAILKITVTGIEEGDASFLASVEGAEEYQDGGRVYYVSSAVEVLAASGESRESRHGGGIEGVRSDGEMAAGIYVGLGQLPDVCNTPPFTVGSGLGATGEGCTIALAPSGAEVVGAVYYPSATEFADPDNPYLSDPVTWIPGA